MRRATLALPLALSLALSVACSRDEARGAGSGFATSPVCETQLARAEAAVPDAPVAEPPAELEEQVRGLVLSRAGAQGAMRAFALQDLVNIGPPAVPVLARILAESERTPEEILSVLEVLGAIDAPESARVLAAQVNLEQVRVPWIRAQAAFQLSGQSYDAVLPHLISQLKYETDGETVIWIAAALAEHANFAGLWGLRVLSGNGATEQIRADAQAMLAKIADDAGFPDGESLWEAWCGPDVEGRVPREEPSPALRAEVWRRIADLAEFDLRIVDDARYALSDSAQWVVEPLVQALHDDVPHVRVHVTQCLARMGPRAAPSCAELVKALDEPHMASSAAAALGAVGCEDAADELIARTGSGHGPEMRDAAASALGRLGSPKAAPALRPLLDPAEPLDLRQAAAQSLLLLEDDRRAAGVLLHCLTAPGADAAAAEKALDAWLERRAAEDAQLGAALEAWRALAPDPRGTPTAAQAKERFRERAAVLAPTLPQAPR